MSGSSSSSSSSSYGTPINTRSRSGSTTNDDARSIRSYGTTTLVNPQSRNDSTFKIPDVDEVDADEVTALLAHSERLSAGSVWRTTLRETWVLVQYAVPIICTTLLEYSFNIVSVISIGHLSTKMLAASTLASLTVSVTGNSIIQGFACALDSLLPQAWTSEHPSHVGLWTQRMMVLVTLVLLPIFVLWQNIEPVLLFLKQDPEVAKSAALYLKFMSLQLPAYAFNTVIRRYLQAQGLFRVPSIITAVVAPINVALNYLLVWGPEPVRLGFIGAPIATSVSVTLMALLHAIYSIYFTPRTAWHPVTSQSFACLPRLFAMGSIGVGQNAAEWWSWEFMSLAVSQLGPTALAAQSVIVVVATMTYNIQYSLGMAAAIRTGNLLGAGDASQAHLSARAATALTLLGGVTFGSMFFIFRHRITSLFIVDEDVSALVVSVMPIVSLYQIVDGIASVEAGTLRACGKLGVVASLNFVAYYVIGLPLGTYLAFWGKLGLPGIWAGLATGLLCASIMIWITVLRLDWDVQVREAKQRVEAGASTPDSAPA